MVERMLFLSWAQNQGMPGQRTAHARAADEFFCRPRSPSICRQAEHAGIFIFRLLNHELTQWTEAFSCLLGG
jgi:hypothetical protein